MFSSWLCLLLLDVLSGCVSHFFRMCLFSNIVFYLVVAIFYLSLPVGDTFFQSDDNGTVSWLLGLDRIFK